MSFADLFKGVTLEVEDLYLLETFQIGYFPGWVPERELAAVLWAYPSVKRFLVKKCPSITDFVERVMAQYGPAVDQQELAACREKVVWTIADLLVYNKCPESYDALEFHNWDFHEVTMITTLDQKVVIDGGAGTGRVALEAARFARQVFAVEPVAQLRQFIREKALKSGLSNVFVIDGFLHAIPLPDGFAEVLITSHALGWRLEDELKEFERVVKKGGFIIHCPGTAEVAGEEAQHSRLVSDVWRYEFSRYRESDGWKRKYWKKL
ncbi:MAG: class I SAM-dependent methyltransferase [Chloroflexota bacterium]